MEATIAQPLPALEGGLNEPEKWWRDHQPWLKERGYQLRPRYAPDWTPSWIKPGREPDMFFESECEDAQPLRGIGNVIDATRLSDGERVVLKRVASSEQDSELEVAQLLSSTDRAGVQNHCTQIYEVMHTSGDEGIVIMVMPLLRNWNSPKITVVGEAVEFIRQVLEGLQFMHSNNVAHRDCKANNIMMDASALYPKGYHFIGPNQRLDWTGTAEHLTRTERPPKYYFVDFGLSRIYDPTNGPPVDIPIFGGDRTVPEFQGNGLPKEYNPFPTDVYCLGHMFSQHFTTGVLDTLSSHGLRPRKGMEFLNELIDEMTREDPAKRPTIDNAVKRFEEIRQSLGTWKLRSRIAERNETFTQRASRNFLHWQRQLSYIIRRMPPVPVT